MSEKRTLSIIAAVYYTAPLMYKIILSNPFLWLAFLLCTLLSGALPALLVPANQIFYDALTGIVVSNSEITHIIIGMGLVIGLMMAGQALGLINQYIIWRRDNVLQPEYKSIVTHKMSLIPAQLFENNEILDSIEKAKNGASVMGSLYILLIDILFKYTSFFIVIGVFLWRMSPLLPLVLFFVFVPVLLSQWVRARIFAEQEDFIVPLARKEMRFSAHARNTYETRLYGVFNYFHEMALKARLCMFARQWETGKKTNIMELGLNLVQVMGMVGIIVLLIRGIIYGDISVGAFVAVFNALSMLFNYMTNFFFKLERCCNRPTRRTSQLYYIHAVA